MTNLPKKYNYQESEKKWQKYWQEKQVYKWEKSLARKDTFVIDTPPPTVSGLLHMGHVFSYVQADFVARYQRMSGKTVFYPMGFDDNGLPTERLVEKVKKIRGVDMDRAEFVKECQSVVDEAEEQFEELFNSIALSVDWDEKYQTISPKSQKISQLSFLDLFKKGLVERKMEPVLWDIVDRTALSQADLVDKEKPSAMNEIVFKIDPFDQLCDKEDESSLSQQSLRQSQSCGTQVGESTLRSSDSDFLESGQKSSILNDNLSNSSSQEIVIATTRPELLPACAAVMVHPEDERYKHLIGKNAVTALFGVKVPIIADELVQMDKGTGAVMCCTFGDETDIIWWRKHNLPLRIILDRAGKIVSEIDWLSSDKYQQIAGLTYKQAREKVLELLKEQNLLLKSEEISHVAKCAERSGVPIEILVTPQWFIKVTNIKEELKKKAAQCNWYPQFMKVRIDQWIDGVSWDWCISRQRFFGVPFPIWYSKRKGEEGKILIADADQLPCDPLKTTPKGYSPEEVEAETDIMDTWATSSVSPQLSSHGITAELTADGDIERHQKLFPADLRPQAHEIIRTWAFYTIVKAYLHEETIPWKNLMISGWCLASDKTKMSKSKGNVVTPNSLIEEKGSDVVRYWASTSHLGADTAYSEDVLKIGGKLLNKLFNAAKFASLNFTSLTEKPATAKQDVEKGIIVEQADLWILSKLHKAIAKATKDFEKFEYARAREAVEDFFWNDFCDNYLEIVKIRCYGLEAQKYEAVELTAQEKQEIVAKQQSGIHAIYHCLEAILKLFSPFIPHLTEELYSAIFADKFAQSGSLHKRGSWPKLDDYINKNDLLEVGDVMLETIAAIRKFKSDSNVSMKTPIKQFTINTNIDVAAILEDLKNVCNCDQIAINNADAELVQNIQILQNS
ncbi:MAG: valine--tRNA ligase [Proteobacteria bacterium]|nr:valine--tRNA ligase [Pseudomonadota bacterium]